MREDRQKDKQKTKRHTDMTIAILSTLPEAK